MPKRYSNDENAGPLRVEVIADSSGVYSSNGVRFDEGEVDLAVEYAKDLASRWTLVTHWRVVKGRVDGKPSVDDEVLATSAERRLF